MKRNQIILWVAVLVMCCLCVNAGTIYGPSGLILTPSAYVPPDKAIAVGVSTFTIKRSGNERRWLSGTFDVGVGGQGEIGLTYLQRTGGGTKTGFGGFGKYQVLKESFSTPAVSLGVDLIGGDVKTQQVYLAATKLLNPENDLNPFALTLGVIYAQDRDGTRRRDSDLFGGFDLKIAPHLNLIAEWRNRTKGSPKDGSGMMLMYGAKDFGLAVGFVNNGSSDRHRFFIGAGYNVNTTD